MADGRLATLATSGVHVPLTGVDRRRFDHFFAEVSVELGRLAPRYALWVCLGELGADPDRVSRQQLIRFCDEHLEAFLADQGMALSPRQQRKVKRAVARFDPQHLSPYDHMARLDDSRGAL